MTPRLVTLCALLVPVIAAAQPAPGEPAPPEPAPAEPAPALPPPAPQPAPAPPATSPVTTPPPLAPTPRGFTSEISAGLAWTSPGLSDGNSSLVRGIAGLNIGIGGFVSQNVAMTLRLSGVTWMDGGLIYLGVIGPNVQAWFGQGFVGGGIGVGFFAGCGGDACGSDTTSGFDLRAGLAFTPHGTVSLEMESIHGFFSQDSLQLVSVLVGYQSF